MTLLRKQTALFALLLAMLATDSNIAGDIDSRAGTSAFPFLKINVGARAVAMGGAFTGLADDESSLYYNPAGITSFDKHRVILGYHNYFVDMQTGFGGYVRQVNENLFVGGYISYLNYGTFIEADQFGIITGEFSGADMVVATTAAMKHGYRLKTGVTVKFIYQSLQNFSATGIAVDLGIKYSSDRDRYSAGFAIQNLGKQLSALGGEKFRLPLTFRAGVAVTPRGLPMRLATDLILPIDNDPIVAIGVEYFEFKPAYFRLGWNSYGSNFRAADSDDSWAGLSLGVGFDIQKMQFSYAFSPGAELGESHRITWTRGF